MPKPPPGQADNVLVLWMATAMGFHLLCSASSRTWTLMLRFACSLALHTIHLLRTARRRLETLEADGDRAEPCGRTKIGTSSVLWKTARWKKAGLVEAREALRVGLGATCDDRTSYLGWSREFLLSSLSMNDRRDWPSLLDY